MKYIPLLFVLLTIGTVGCAANSLEELMVEAKECVDQSTNLAGVIGASDEQRTACWADANKKLEMMAKREKQMEEEAAGRCPGRLVAWCDWKGCRCVSPGAVRDAFRRAGYY